MRDALFETMLVVDGVVALEQEHYARMARSARELGLGSFGAPASSPADAGAVLGAASGGGSGTLPASAAGTAALRVVFDGIALSETRFPIPEKTLRRRAGARVITLDRSIRRERPEHKLLSYLHTMPTLPHDIEEALFLDAHGHVLEGTNTNVFAVDGDTLITADQHILPGIMRAQLLKRAKRVIFRPPTIDELRRGGLLTSSLTLIAPIVSIDGIPCARPELF